MTAKSATRGPLSVSRLEELYASMLQIRLFEQHLLGLYRSQGLSGTTHTYIGQEAIAVGALRHLQPGDGVVSNHRCHGHYLAYGGDPRALFLEIIGDRNGVCRGVGGSQHLHVGRFYSNGVLGGTIPVATGLGLADCIRDSGNTVVCFLGDGALGEGVTYESLNIASLWRVPILFVLENNRYAQSTPIALNLAGSIRDRFEAFGIESDEIEGSDALSVDAALKRAVHHVRSARRPFCQIVNSYRLEAHSKGDDTRDPHEIEAYRKIDALALTEQRLPKDRLREIRDEVSSRIATAFEPVGEGSGPTLDDIAPDFPPPALDRYVVPWRLDREETMLHEIRTALVSLFEERDDVHLLGEDVLDPYGGAFKVTSGLSTRFADRVWTTPVSEAAIVGVANGLALSGLRPIVEIMFGDFSMLAMDQIVNGATKFSRMYGGSVRCPVIIRTPMGGRRGYGPTHSQSLEKLFVGIPGLTVIAADPIHDQRYLWQRMFELEAPCLYVENKALYGTRLPRIEGDRLGPFRLTTGSGFFPITRLSLGTPVDAAIVCYGGMVLAALDAAKLIFESTEKIIDVVVVSCLAPLDIRELQNAVGSGYPLIVVEEGTKRGGFGSELVAALADYDAAFRPIRRIAAPDTIVPSDSRLEQTILPGVDEIVRVVRSVLP
jgi:2-oxoisovalerate dehydrogenase E1 component